MTIKNTYFHKNKIYLNKFELIKQIQLICCTQLLKKYNILFLEQKQIIYI